jgi:hypothetical protein
MVICLLAAAAALDVAIAATTTNVTATNIITLSHCVQVNDNINGICIAKPTQHDQVSLACFTSMQGMACLFKLSH